VTNEEKGGKRDSASSFLTILTKRRKFGKKEGTTKMATLFLRGCIREKKRRESY